MNQSTYESYKRQVRGFYWKFNTQVLRFHMYKIFDYETLLNTAKDFETFEGFYEFHTKNRQEVINEHLDLMFNEAENKQLNPTKELVEKCLIVRLGNIYNGMYIENKILEVFNNLTDYITCEKTDKEIDMHYKVDAIIELVGVDKFSIQIKPFTFTKYDNGSELSCHERFNIEFGMKVVYLFYKDRNTIIFNGNEIKMNNKNRIIEQIEKILVYN